MMNNMEELTLHEKQQISLNVLKKVIEVCEKLNLTYWITYGTLLGAIRHGGFIPWDDDLDIAMKADEYEILVQYINDNPDECYPLVVHNKNTVKNCFYNISRVCDIRYNYVFTEFNYCSGAFIDIYPYEALGKEDERVNWEKWFLRNTYLKKFINMSCSRSIFYGRNTITKIANLPKCIYSKLKGNMFFLKKMDSYTPAEWDESEIVGVPRWGAGIYKHYYKEFIIIKFEDIYVNAPKEYDLILKEAYGDYMQYPPKEQRKPYHGYKAYRVNKKNV